MLRFGPSTGPVVVAALPLFEEANRTRTFVVTLLRMLAERGIASLLPDLPGQGESLRSTATASLADWRNAFAAAVKSIPNESIFAIAVRGGALLDAEATLAGRWHFAPMLGEVALRELIRVARASDPQRTDLDPVDFERLAPIEIAGNMVSPHLLRELGSARPGAARIVRLATDPGDANTKFEGAPLWRRAEPDNDPALAELLADDIAAWVRACVA